MSAPVERMIRAITKIKILEHEAFTSVDVANEIKRHGVWVRNRDVAERLRQCVERWAKEVNEDYIQEKIRVDAGKSMRFANVYMPVDESVSDDYLKRDQKAISPVDFEKMHKTSVMPWNSRDQKGD